jgi:hypothetical protein
MKRKLYMIERASYGYDETIGAVISANTRSQALEIARTLTGDQPKSVWDSKDVQIRLIGRTELPVGVVFESYNAG